MIFTYSSFYYIDPVDADNFRLPFDEGSGEINAELEPGGYSLNELMVETKKALDVIGTQSYTVIMDRNSRFVTISATSSFDLLLSSGTTLGTDVFGLLGFTQGSDLTGATSYTGASPSGFEYKPQFRLQSYVDKEDWQMSAGGVVHKAASGAIETVTFGIEKFFEMDIKFATNNDMGCNPIKGNSSGVEDLRSFMQNITKKGRFEFMPDVDDKNTFDTVILEKSPGNSKGIGYKLKELFNEGMPGIYETGLIKLRVV